MKAHCSISLLLFPLLSLNGIQATVIPPVHLSSSSLHHRSFPDVKRGVEKEVITTVREISGSIKDAIKEVFQPVKPPQRPNAICNGSSQLCSRKYGNITHIGAHNSFGYTKNPLEFSANQQWDVTGQLNAGVRLLQGQVHLDKGQMKLCHTKCLDPIFYDGGPFVNYLKKVKTWLDANPQQVVTLLLGNADRHRGADLSSQWRPQFVNAGLEPLVYRPPSIIKHRDDWPTLKELIDSKKPLIVFLNYGANTTKVDYLLPEFDYMWENPFTETKEENLSRCEVDRVNGSPAGKMYLMHHSLNYKMLGSPAIVPSRYSVKRINKLESILRHSRECAKLGENRWPNFILLDFVDSGEPFKAMRYFNNI